MTRAFNAILRFIFGLLPDGGGRAYFHWQNLREDSRGKRRGFPWEGRAWLRFHRDRKPDLEFEIDWHVPRFAAALGVEVGAGDGDQLQFHIALPPFSFWWSVSGILPRALAYKRRVTDLRIFDWAIWWNVWNDDNNWNSRDQKWKHGNFHFLDFLLGRTEYSSETLQVLEVVVPMPEGNYPSTVTMREDTWKRPRWFPMRLLRADVDLKVPIPHHGKGTCDYNCGDDALHSLSCVAATPEQAIAKAMEAAMRSRRRYGSGVMEKWPAPKTTSAA